MLLIVSENSVHDQLIPLSWLREKAYHHSTNVRQSKNNFLIVNKINNRQKVEYTIQRFASV